MEEQAHRSKAIHLLNLDAFLPFVTPHLIAVLMSLPEGKELHEVARHHGLPSRHSRSVPSAPAWYSEMQVA